jgi:hypothetical protein
VQVDPHVYHGAWLLSMAHPLLREKKPSAFPILSSGRMQVADLVQQLGLPLALDLKSTERVTQAVGARLRDVTLQP